jgi:UDP-N-acetyl-D-mannosaminuronic acid transferase (WecB/TagA/CpsF family)
VNKFRDSVFNRGIGTKTDVLHQVGDIGISFWDIAGLQWKVFFLGSAAKAVLKGLDKMHQLYTVVVSDVVQAIRSWA